MTQKRMNSNKKASAKTVNVSCETQASIFFPLITNFQVEMEDIQEQLNNLVVQLKDALMNFVIVQRFVPD